MTTAYVRYPAPGGNGTVTSVGLTAPNIFSVSGSPVIGAGTIDLSLTTKTANFIFAGPTTGSAAAPTFRALVAADIPSLSAVYLSLGGGTLTGGLIGTTGSFSSTLGASNLSGTNTGDITLAAVGSTPSANGASFASQVLTLQPADGTHPGLLTSGAQTIGGLKTFSTGAVITGVIDGSAAASGVVGQIITSTSSLTSLTSATGVNLTSISLPAGRYLVSAIATLNSNSAVVTFGNSTMDISTTTGSGTGTLGLSQYNFNVDGLSGVNVSTSGSIISFAVNITGANVSYFLNMTAPTFTGGPMRGIGTITAQRIG